MKLLIYHAKQCNPKACTSNKLKKFRLAEVFYTPSKIPRNSIILNPYADKVLSKEDKRYMKHGLVALDCSWKRAYNVFGTLKKPYNDRVLPLLIAGNPINYGKIKKLSTVESLASALYILGYPEYGENILQKFKWGPSFLELNRELLEDYAQAKNEEEVIKKEKEWIKLWQDSKKQRKDYFT
jgi:pre-rRNA-processing protein TSR3